MPIFPFGCNNSQYVAVKRAMENQISVIQGPPGTGKTQTILNIIANILIQGKTVQVVSNNNSATENVFEKPNVGRKPSAINVIMLGQSMEMVIHMIREPKNTPSTPIASEESPPNSGTNRDPMMIASDRIKKIVSLLLLLFIIKPLSLLPFPDSSTSTATLLLCFCIFYDTKVIDICKIS